jgi:hypothetical protein
MDYVLVPATSQRLVKVAAELGLQHQGVHNVGPSWYGDAQSLLRLANLSIPVMHHIYSRHFEHRPEGGLVQAWGSGEGWPEWSGGGIAMYATELAANHAFERIERTETLDHHSDTQASVHEAVLQIHCRHGSKDFDKFEFFRTHYDGVDLGSLDKRRVQGYATWLAVSAWRELGGSSGKSEL